MTTPRTLYRMVSMVDGKAVTIETYTLDKSVIAGPNKNPNVRDELKSQPVLQGWCGPMWDGNNVIRYETKAAYNHFST